MLKQSSSQGSKRDGKKEKKKQTNKTKQNTTKKKKKKKKKNCVPTTQKNKCKSCTSLPDGRMSTKIPFVPLFVGVLRKSLTYHVISNFWSLIAAVIRASIDKRPVSGLTDWCK